MPRVLFLGICLDFCYCLWRVLLTDAYGTDLVVHQGGKYVAPLVVADTRFEDEEAGKLTVFLQQFL